MSLLHIFILMLPIIIPILVGFLFREFGIFTHKTGDYLLKLLLYVAFPSLIISNLAQEHLWELLNIPFILATIIGTVLMYAVTYVSHRYFFHRDLRFTAMASLCVAFVSAGIVGIPIMDSLIGIENTLLPVILNTSVALMTVVPLTIFIIKLQLGHKHTLMDAFKMTFFDVIKNPLIASSLIGLFLVLFDLRLPLPIVLTLKSLGSATVPVALITIGIGINIKTLQKDIDEILYLSFLRVIISSLIGFLIALFLHLPPQLAVAFVMIMSMPTAKTVPALAEKYEFYVSDSLQIVTVTTILAILVMPIIVIVANSLWPGVIN